LVGGQNLAKKKIVADVWFSATNVWQILVETVWMAAKSSSEKSTQLLQKIFELDIC
jgi:hypothetical protein